MLFKLEAVLTPSHPLWEAAKSNEQHYYRLATLAFRRVENVDWTARSNRRSTDESGETDLGNIDAFELLGANAYRLEGDWGAVRVTARTVSIDLAPPT